MSQKEDVNKLQSDIQSKLLNTSIWKAKAGYEIRSEYDKSRRLINGTKVERRCNLNNKQQLNMESTNKTDFTFQMESTDKNYSIFKKSEKINLEQLSFDKIYFQRMLLEEELRMIYLRKGKLNENILREKPHIRLHMESLINNMCNKSSNIKKIAEREIKFLDKRHKINKELQLLQNFKCLNLGQLYNIDLKKSLEVKTNIDNLLKHLGYLWRMYDKKLYFKVEKDAKSFIESVTNWKEKHSTPTKLRILSDLYYIRGLALMNLGNYDVAFKCFRKDGEIGESANLKISINRTKDNIGRIHALRGNYNEAIKLWISRLREITEIREKPWFYFVIAQCYALKENYLKAIEMSNRCIVAAQRSNLTCWEFNGNILLANFSALYGSNGKSVILKNTTVSLKAINRAFQCSLILADADLVEKMTRIVANIYFKFKDKDLSLITSTWASNLIKIAKGKCTTHLDTVKKREIVLSDSEKESFDNDDGFLGNLRNMSNIKKEIFTEINYTVLPNPTVDVYLTDIYNLNPSADQNDTRLTDTISTSPIKFVEIILSNQSDNDDVDSEWHFESELEDI